MKYYIVVDMQEALEYWVENLYPVFIAPEDVTGDTLALFDRWIDWLVGHSCLDGNDGEYRYPYSWNSLRRLQMFGVPARAEKR